MKKALAVLLVTTWLGGCVSQVRNGAIVGGLSGAAAGAGIGWVISDKDLAGSGSNPASGPVDLPQGQTIATGALIGLTFGAIVGAMIGHRSVPDFEAPDYDQPAAPPATEAAGADTAAVASPTSF